MAKVPPSSSIFSPQETAPVEGQVDQHRCEELSEISGSSKQKAPAALWTQGPGGERGAEKY